MESSKKEYIKFSLLMIALMGLFILSKILGLHEKLSVENIKSEMQALGYFAPFVFVLLYVISSATLIFPEALLSMASGMVWGPYLGTVYTVVGALFGAGAAFGISRYFGRGFMQKILKDTKAGVCDRFLSKNGFMSIFVMRLIPLFPWEFVNYVSGICGFRFRDYLLATFIGTIPGSFTYNLIGASLGEPIDKFRIVLIFSLVIGFGIIVLTYRKFSSKNKQ
ncbi:MAG: TVP38/TMEM64 family protein [Deltaproteobacteria bacterium]|nr:TVP38/TMEM64 family protein [Deltaproteobacteria bacterium]